MLSPNPGVSTTVSAIRIPSSSSSGRYIQIILAEGLVIVVQELTDVSRLYFDARFNMSLFRAFDDLVRKDIRLTQRIHKGCASCPRSAFGDGVNIVVNPLM